MAIEKLAQKVLTFGSPYPPVEGQGLVSLPQVPQSAAHLSHVRVDRETGAVTVLGHVVAQDVGRALNPALVKGQMHGGTTQGLGWALLEEIGYDEHGQPIAGSFVEYAMPTSGVVPAIDTEIVEVPAPEGPYGAKGVGEAPVIGVAGAVANAIAAAAGGRAPAPAADDPRAGVAGDRRWQRARRLRSGGPPGRLTRSRAGPPR